MEKRGDVRVGEATPVILVQPTQTDTRHPRLPLQLSSSVSNPGAGSSVGQHWN